jgi:mannose-6-phosphate isomerase-like protein (cupin superfamily)
MQHRGRPVDFPLPRSSFSESDSQDQEEDEMSDVTVKRIEDFDSPNGGGFCRARASLGVTAFGLQVEQFPANFEHYPEHDHSDDGQEEVYTLLAGSAILHVGGKQFPLSPGVFARVAANATRKITTGSEPAQLLAIGGVPGGAYSAPAFTEEGAAMPG